MRITVPVGTHVGKKQQLRPKCSLVQNHVSQTSRINSDRHQTSQTELNKFACDLAYPALDAVPVIDEQARNLEVLYCRRGMLDAACSAQYGPIPFMRSLQLSSDGDAGAAARHLPCRAGGTHTCKNTSSTVDEQALQTQNRGSCNTHSDTTQNT